MFQPRLWPWAFRRYRKRHLGWASAVPRQQWVPRKKMGDLRGTKGIWLGIFLGDMIVFFFLDDWGYITNIDTHIDTHINTHWHMHTHRHTNSTNWWCIFFAITWAIRFTRPDSWFRMSATSSQRCVFGLCSVANSHWSDGCSLGVYRNSHCSHSVWLTKPWMIWMWKNHPPAQYPLVI